MSLMSSPLNNTLMEVRPAASDLFSQAAIGLAYLNSAGHFLRANDVFCELLAYDECELIERSWEQIALGDEGRGVHGLDSLFGGEGTRIEFNGWFVRAGGDSVEAHVVATSDRLDNEPVVLVQLCDRTEQAEALTSLFAAEQRFSAVASCSSDAILWIRVLPECRVLAVNDAAIEATGYSAREFYDEPELQQRIIHPDDWHLLMELATGRSGAGGAVLRWITRDGEIRWMELRVSVLAEVGGSASELLCVGRDKTDQIAADRAKLNLDARRRFLVALSEREVVGSDLTSLLVELASTTSHLLSVDLVAAFWESNTGGDFQMVTELLSTTETVDAETLDVISRHAGRIREQGAGTWVSELELVALSDVGEEPNHITSGVGVPINFHGRVVGVLGLYAAGRRTIDPSDVSYIQIAASEVTALMQRAEGDAHPPEAMWRDRLTRLPGRAGLVEWLSQLQVPGCTEPVLLTWCDIDDFTSINEAEGTVVGDEVLVIIANRLRALYGDSFVARVGGGSFAIATALSNDCKSDGISRAALDVLKQSLATSRGPLTVSMSAGDALGQPGDTSESVIARGVSALHVAQRVGRGHVRHAPAPSDSDDPGRTELINALHHAVKGGEIRPFFQPIMSLPDESVISFEALARWERPDGTSIPPDVFIPLAEETGAILEIGAAVLDEACAFLADVRESTGSDLVTMKVNVSVQQLQQTEFVDEVRSTLDRYALAGQSLCLELTESLAILTDPVVELELLRLKELGVRLAIDDFGTGYSNFAYLTQLPIDTLKLDRSMVAQLHDDPRRMAVVKAILSLTRTLGITVVAEGVESE